MDVSNLGSSDIDLRLMVANPLLGPPTDLAFSQTAVHIPAASGWISVRFSLDLTELGVELGSADTVLRTATELRLYHSSAAGFPGEGITAQIGVDNIRAVAVPEPAFAGGLMGVGLVAYVLVRRVSRK
jgi:hypothetical protein